MRIKQAADNGNVATYNIPYGNSDNRSWLTSNNTESNTPYENRTDSQLNINSNHIIYDLTEITDTFVNYTSGTESGYFTSDSSNVHREVNVCNRQYRINTRHNANAEISLKDTNSVNLEEGTKTVLGIPECFSGNSNVYSDETPIEDDRVFDHSDTDEMSENGIHSVPRGIVNPNYPGFQHLAHTLQDYSSNIENFYHSENDMTDDDADIEITELAFETETIENGTCMEYKNNNNIINKENSSKILSPQNDYFSRTILDSHNKNEIPDLLKTISKNNNNEALSYDLNCSDADIENNFHTKDIIGDFNKEIEEEIKLVLNYNINIQDDLEELRKDIKDTLAKPIETTINNISEVVNHVIKKLVETKSDFNEDVTEDKLSENNRETQKLIEELIDINKDNEKNTRTEMNLSRPTFLLIENNTSTKIDDALLSDGKDEINISEYDTETMSYNVENTIKQLSTELRKIIPKLDEMKERDRLWAIKDKNERDSIITDGNSNEIGNTSKYNFASAVNTQTETEVSTNVRFSETSTAVKNTPLASKIESKGARDRQKEITSPRSCIRNAQIISSVRKNDSAKDVDLDSFDVYNIETALPKLDLDAIENHLKAAKEAERRSLDIFKQDQGSKKF